MKQYIILILFLLGAGALQGRVGRLQIRKNSSKRILLYHDFHFPDKKPILDEQIASLHRAFKSSKKPKDVQIVVESHPSYQTQKIRKLTKLQSELINTIPENSGIPVKALKMRPKKQILPTLAKSLGDTAFLPDERLVLYHYISLSEAAIHIPLLLLKNQSMYETCHNILGNHKLTVREFWNSFKQFFDKGKQQVLALKKVLKNRDNRDYVEKVIADIDHMQGLIKKALIKSKPHHTQKWGLYLHDLVLSGLKNHPELPFDVTDALGEEAYELMRTRYNFPSVFEHVFDATVLLEVLTSNASSSHIVSGAGHCENINNILDREGFKLTYDSYIHMKNNKVFTSTLEFIKTPKQQNTPKETILKTIATFRKYKRNLKPIDAKIFAHTRLNKIGRAYALPINAVNYTTY